ISGDICKELDINFGKNAKFIEAVRGAMKGQQKKKEEKENEQVKKSELLKGHNQTPKKKVSLLFLDETGVGKLTLLQALQDYTNGVKYEQVKKIGAIDEKHMNNIIDFVGSFGDFNTVCFIKKRIIVEDQMFVKIKRDKLKESVAILKLKIDASLDLEIKINEDLKSLNVANSDKITYANFNRTTIYE
ncbi:hypothetical protein RFI_25145, partial [Reticulomyxa filosa]